MQGRLIFSWILLVASHHILQSYSFGVKHFTYEVIKELPHPSSHFTQGFTFRISDGALIEGTGLNGRSILTAYEMANDGTPLKPKIKVDLPKRHFGEGIAELKGKLYQLTWQDGKVYVWDSETFKLLETRKMPPQLVEGWGVCTSPGHDALIMSDGSGKLFWMVPDAASDGGFHLRKEIIVTDCQDMPYPAIVGGLNELEIVPLRITHPEETETLHTSEGAPNFEHARQHPVQLGATVFANVYGSNCVAIIDPLNGQIKGYIHLDGIYPGVSQNKVMNGIAYRDEDESLYVTGKNWEKMFKIKLKLLDAPPDVFPNNCKTTWGSLGNKPKEKYPDNLCWKRRRTEL